MKKLTDDLTLRSRELGFFGLLQHIWKRGNNKIKIWGLSLWWGWKSRKEMSDSAFLAQTTGEFCSLEVLLDHLAKRSASSFLFPHESAQATNSLLVQHFPEYLSAVISAADAACRNELNLLGKVIHFPNGIDWQADPVTGYHFPSIHRSRVYQYLGSERPVDLIVFWELNRHQHFITLGIAYWLTGEQKYLNAFNSQIQNWIDANPLQTGVNWYYPLEVSIRLLAWTVAFQFFRNSEEFREKTGKSFLKSFWQQADFLSRHLQTTRTDIPNNHMIAELTGLVIISAAFPEFRASAKWQAAGLKLLSEQLDVQTHSDGVNKEQAAGYHRFVADLLLLVIARSHQSVIPNMPDLKKTFEKMLDYILYFLTPIGTSPQWGDSDYGRALGLGKNKDYWDFRPILSAGAALFGRADWKFAAGHFDEEAFWLLGSNGLSRWQQIDVHAPDQNSRAFPQAGHYIIRDSWTADSDVAYFRCGPFGLGGEGHCAHAHADLLSIILWIKGHPVIVDSGTFTYHGPLRDYFRLTAAHNTILVDGIDQANPLPNFNWKRVPQAKCLDWVGNSVTGAMSYSNQVEFIRELRHPQPGSWELVDKFEVNEGSHNLTWFFHFAPGLEVKLDKESAIMNVGANGEPFISVYPPAGVQLEIKDGWVSSTYGNKESISILQGVWEGMTANRCSNFIWKFEAVNIMDEVVR